MSFVITPPKVSIPSDNGVTSRSNTSVTSPVRTPPWIAAPTATTSSGLTPFDGVLPKNCFTFSWTAGIRVEPPTNKTSSISDAENPESFNACWQGAIVALIRRSASCSNCERVKVFTKCFGTPSTGIMYGRLISDDVDDDNSIFAFSAASFRRWSAIESLRRSTPFSFWNSSASHSMITWSKSSPPRWVSPLVDLTSKTPSPSSRIEISNVPPPRSNTATFISLFFLSRP